MNKNKKVTKIVLKDLCKKQHSFGSPTSSSSIEKFQKINKHDLFYFK